MRVKPQHIKTNTNYADISLVTDLRNTFVSQTTNGYFHTMLDRTAPKWATPVARPCPHPDGHTKVTMQLYVINHCYYLQKGEELKGLHFSREGFSHVII